MSHLLEKADIRRRPILGDFTLYSFKNMNENKLTKVVYFTFSDTYVSR